MVWPFSGAQGAVASAEPNDATLELVEGNVPSTPATPSPSAHAAKSLKRTHDQIDDGSSDQEHDAATSRQNDEGSLGKIITIIVGKGHDVKTFQIHRKFLCKSRYFKRAFELDWERSSYDFPDEDPRIFERLSNWIYGEGFLLPKDDAESDEADWLSTQASQEAPKDLATENLNFGFTLANGKPSVQSATSAASDKYINMHDDDNDFSDNERNEQAEQAAQAFRDVATNADAPTPLDTMTLSKIYALAELLEIAKLRNEIIDLLIKRLCHDMITPGAALVYAFERCDPDSPLRRLLVRFTSRSAPIDDFLGKSTLDPLSRALIEGLANVRGDQRLDQAESTAEFEREAGNYHVRVLSLHPQKRR